MNKILLKITLTALVAFKSLFLMAMEPQANFDEDVDKLIFVAKAQTQYLGNWLSLIKENSPEAHNFLENFIFPVGGQELRKVRAILDFYMDYLFSKYIELSLVNLKTSKAQELNGEIDSGSFQNKLSQFYENIRRARDTTIGDVIKRGSDYLSTQGVKVAIENNQRTFKCDAHNSRGVIGAELLTKIGLQDTSNLKIYTDSINLVFGSDAVTSHYFNQVLNLDNISDVLSKYSNKISTKRYFNELGGLNFTYDVIYKTVLADNSFNNSLTSKIGLEEAVKGGRVLEQKQKKTLGLLRERYKNVNSLEFLPNEDDFIERQVQAIFQTNKTQEVKRAGDSGWGSNPAMNQFNKSKKQTGPKKQPKKSTKNIRQNAKSETRVETAQTKEIILNTAAKQEVQTENSRDLDFNNIGVFFLNQAPPYATGAYPIIIQYLDLKTLCNLISTSKNIHQFFLEAKKIGMSEIVFEEELFDFDEWYKNNVTAYFFNKNAPIESVSSKYSLSNKPQFYGLGEVFLNVVFGQGYVEVTTKHFNSFLKQAGGYKVKMSQNGYVTVCLKDKSVETHYTVPNLTETRHETPFCLYLVHQPHAASLPFPKKTLYNFLRRDLIKAGYARAEK